jgi:hypothetical protein
MVIHSLRAQHLQSDALLNQARTILSYPLTPFFVLFCNVVITSNPRDLQLLQDVVDSVASLVAEIPYVEKLHRLCNTLLTLCKPLVQSNTTTGQEPEPPASISEMNNTDATLGTEIDTSIELTPWDDEMMWQLFQCQPSLDWFNSDILDPDSWDLNLPS